jgi:hypothetical protein
MSQQFGRKWSLTVAGDTSQIDLSELRIKFSVKSADKETPQTANIRVYNVSDQLASMIGPDKEFTEITLNAGYEDGNNFAVIFQGSVVQTRKGHEDSLNSYIDILGADGDIALNGIILNATLAAGSTPRQRIDAINTALGIPVGYVGDVSGPTLPRGKVMLGMPRDIAHAQAISNGMTYFISKGKIYWVPLDGARPDEAVVVNATTGMIGWPEVTEMGIKVRMLLNPRVDIGCKLQLNNADILRAQAAVPGTLADTAYQNLLLAIPIDGTKADGSYYIYVIEYVGDTRGNEWFTDCTCLSTSGGFAPQQLGDKYGYASAV